MSDKKTWGKKSISQVASSFRQIRYYIITF